MYELTVRTHISSAHYLRGYEGKCANLHGHNWRIAVSIRGESVDETGLLVDFALLKRRIANVLDSFDHKDINEVEPFDRLNPSSENLAKNIFEKVRQALADLSVDVSKVVVGETDNVECAYWEE